MTQKEEAAINQLQQIIRDIQNENLKFKQDVLRLVETIETKVNNKHLPVSLELDIMNTTNAAIQSSIKEVLTKYDSPLAKLVKVVVDENSAELKSLISASFTEVIRTDIFKESIRSAFSHKVARSIISNNDGLFDRVSNELKQDTIFKSKMALAVANVVDECLKLRQS